MVFGRLSSTSPILISGRHQGRLGTAHRRRTVCLPLLESPASRDAGGGGAGGSTPPRAPFVPSSLLDRGHIPSRSCIHPQQFRGASVSFSSVTVHHQLTVASWEDWAPSGVKHHEPCFWRVLPLEEWTEYVRWAIETNEDDEER